MSKFVDIDPILQYQYLGYTRVCNTEWQKGYWEGVDTVCDRLREAPTIDAVPVVRCKDCKHSDDECHKDNLRYCMRGIRTDDYNETGYIYPVEEVVRDDDFCSYGERKDGADNG